MREFGIGLLGLGTVGSGVLKGLQENGEVLAERLGAKLVVRKIADIDLSKAKNLNIDPAIMTTDAYSVINDPKIDIIVELIGGMGPAKEFILKSLKLKKPVITANKALLANNGSEIFETACANNTDICFGASVGGGIPIIRVLREGLIANKVESMYGIVNGTCNYILTKMGQDGMTFEAALKEAQAKGYAETNPSFDIDGIDSQHKTTLLSSLAFGLYFPVKDVSVSGIRDVTERDMRFASELGYTIKLLAVIKSGKEVEARVHPTLIPKTSPLAAVNGVFNAIMVNGDMTGRSIYYGRGAGQMPTAATVLADVCEVVRNIMAKSPLRMKPIPGAHNDLKIKPVESIETRYYLRLSLMDRPNVMATVTSIFGKHGISLASVLQKELKAGKYVTVLIITHTAKEKNIQTALEEINSLDVVGSKSVMFRIEDI